jgi:hypothetical protein
VRKGYGMNDDRERALVSLRAIRESLEDSMSDVTIRLVAEYHLTLDELEKTGVDVSDFRIPDSWVQGPDVPFIFGGHLGVPRVKRELFLIKLDSILEYLA